MEEDLKWMSLGELKTPEKRETKITYDEEVSKVLGKPIRTNDPKLISLVVKWNKQRKGDDDMPDNHLSDPNKIKELKKVFNVQS